jgi:hypothetical protein
MKKSYLLKASALSLAILFAITLPAQDRSEILEMGPGYAQDIYYSMQDGEIAQADRANWDIGFYTQAFSAGIITNGAAGMDGVALYTYPNADTNGWNIIDTAGMSTWTALYNSPDEWEEGAFSRNALGHPDYGWGTYNMVTHDVTGDSIYLIRLADGTLKKLWIVKKNSINNTYFFRFANIDNSEEVNVELDCNPYTGKNFIYYSLSGQKVVDREPAKDSWDILFTKYMSLQASGVYYPVTGVLNNVNVAANKFTSVAPGFDDWSAMPMDTSRSPIGYDWKEFELSSFEWTVLDSVAYFVQDLKGDVYKLLFTDFEGTSTGVIGFEKALTSPLGIPDSPSQPNTLSVYPNPAREMLFIDLPAAEGAAGLELISITGQLVHSEHIALSGSQEVTGLNLSNIRAGMYIIRLTTDGQVWTGKVSVR